MGVHRVTWWLDKATQGYTGLQSYTGLHGGTQGHMVAR